MTRVVSTSIINHRSTIFARLLLLIGLNALWFAAIISTTTGFTPTNVLSSRHYSYGSSSSSSSSSLLMSSRDDGVSDNRGGGGGYDKHNPGANRRKKPQDFDNDYSFNDNRNDNRNENNNGKNNDNDNDYKGRNRYSTSGEKKNYNDDDNSNNNGRGGGGGGRGRRSGGRSSNGGQQASRGRGRGGRSTGGRGGRTGSRGQQNHQQRRSSEYYELERPPVPPFTSRPTYYTCRHTYEATLQEEIERSCKGVSFSIPHPGLLQLLPASSDAMLLPQQQHQQQPTYALQTLPNCVIISAESIKGLANEVMNSLLLVNNNNNSSKNEKNTNANIILIEELMMASQGSLAIHTLVPEMFRGTPESKLRQYNRIQKVGNEIASQLKKVCKAARPSPVNNNSNDDNDVAGTTEDKWLLQLLLLEPQIIAASFTKCTSSSSSNSNVETLPTTTTTTTWPNWYLPGGLALVDINNSNGNNEDDDYGDEQQQQQQQQQRRQQKSSHRINSYNNNISYNNNNQINIPSSAYRKLLEAFWYMGDRPPSYNYEYPVIDLGASPGGWTSVLRLMECNVIAVDRSPLDQSLMMDKERIEFIQGDAFKYRPPWVSEYNKNGRITKLETPIPDTWMVSDIIAYPNKIIELIETWTSNNYVSHLIVTIKFQSNDIPWNDIDSAKQIAIQNNYLVNTVHFFNNKNEITFMAIKQQQQNNNNNRNHNSNIREESSTSNDSNDDNDDTSSSSSLLIGKPMYAPILPKQKQQSKNKKKSTTATS